MRYLDDHQTFLLSTKQSNGTAGGDVGGGVDVNHDGSKVAFTTRTGLDDVADPHADTDGEPDVYVTSNIKATKPTVTWVSYTVNNEAGSDSADDVAISNDGSWIGWTNDTGPWVAACSTTCTDADPAGFNPPVPPQGAQQARDISFGYSTNGTSPGAPTHVFWTTDGKRVDADTNNADDTYSRGLPVGYADGVALLTTGTYANGAYRGSATDSGSVIVFDSGPADLPGAATTLQCTRGPAGRRRSCRSRQASRRGSERCSTARPRTCTRSG